MTETSQELPDVSFARAAFARGEWLAARNALQAAAAIAELPIEDLERLNLAAWFAGDGPGSMADCEVLFERLADEGSRTEAAHLALRLSLEWALSGELTIASGWIARADRLLVEEPDQLVKGYAVYCRAAMSLDVDGEPGPAHDAAQEVCRVADLFHDPALACLGKVLNAMAAVRSGRAVDGFSELDEAMLAVLAGRLHPLWAGDAYCSTIHLCEELGDLSRMRAWTDTLERWAAPLSRTFVYAGVTRVHQLQLVSAEGDWDRVEAELGPISEQIGRSHVWVAGAGYTELGDTKRLRGDLAGAQAAYDRAAALGVDPQPGHALLLHVQGRSQEALAELRASLGQCGRLGRAKLLLEAAELALGQGDRVAAHQLVAELVDTGEFFGTPGLMARAHQGQALMSLAAGNAADAVRHLETAAHVYRDQRFRYRLAQVHESLARARRTLGDRALAEADDATALAIYRQLGAMPDVERLAPAARPGSLTDREAEVLACVATGASNREVGTMLFISDKTVSRHLANIFAKAGVSSRTAAAVWAREHGIVPRGPV